MRVLVVGVVVLLLAAVLVAASALRIEPALPLLLLGALPGVIWFVARFPAALIPPLLFAGQLKGRAAEGFSFTDPTMVSLFLLCGAMGMAVLLRVSSRAKGAMLERLFSQWKGLLAFAAVAASIVLSYLIADSSVYSTEKIVRFAVFSTLVFVAPLCLIRNEDAVRHFSISMWLFATLLAIKLLLHVSEPANPYGALAGRSTDVTRITSGQLIGMTILLLMFVDLGTSKVLKILVACSVPVLVLGLIASTARGPILSFLLVATCAMAFGHFRAGLVSSNVTRIGVIGLTIAALVVGLAWIEHTGARRKFQAKEQELVRMFLGGTSNGAQSAGKRLDRYQAAAQAIEKHPLVGLGLGGWSLFYGKSDARDYPHNVFLEIAVEQGVIGLTAFSLLLAAVLLELKTISARNEAHKFLLPVVSFAIIVSLFSGDLNDNRALWMWCGFVLALSSLSYTAPVKTQTPHSPFSPLLLPAVRY